MIGIIIPWREGEFNRREAFFENLEGVIGRAAPVSRREAR
jgi:hypothetical protein